MRKVSPRTEKILAIAYSLFYLGVTILFWLTAHTIGNTTSTLYVMGIAFGLLWYPILHVIVQWLKSKVKKGYWTDVVKPTYNDTIKNLSTGWKILGCMALGFLATVFYVLYLATEIYDSIKGDQVELEREN